MSDKSGGTAFPIVHPDGSGVQYFGMSLRDYFAANALQGQMQREQGFVKYAAHIAETSYQLADAMLLERSK